MSISAVRRSNSELCRRVLRDAERVALTTYELFKTAVKHQKHGETTIRIERFKIVPLITVIQEMEAS